MAAASSGSAEPPKGLNRAQRRERQRQVIKYVLDGPRREPVCGQAKAGRRTRARATGDSGPRLSKGNTELKALAWQLKRTTGRPYAVCLAEVRAWAQTPKPETEADGDQGARR